MNRTLIAAGSTTAAVLTVKMAARLTCAPTSRVQIMPHAPAPDHGDFVDRPDRPLAAIHTYDAWLTKAQKTAEATEQSPLELKPMMLIVEGSSLPVA